MVATLRLRCASGLIGATLSVLSASASPILRSYFETDTEGWTVNMLGRPGEAPLPGGTGPVHFSTGGVGNSGYIQTEDTANGRLYFVAPPAWAGDYYGTSLAFWLLNPNPNVLPVVWPSGALQEPLVMLSGGGLDLHYFAGVPPAATWIYNSVPLVEGVPWYVPEWYPGGRRLATTAEVQTVLRNLTTVRINADWVSRFWGHPLGDFGHDITSLDQVRLGVPEPPTTLMLVISLALLAVHPSRRGRKA